MNLKIAALGKLIGEVAKPWFARHECFFSEDVALAVPVGLSSDVAAELHTHPTYAFILSFDDSGAFKVMDNVLVNDPGKVVALSPNVIHEKYPSELPPRYVSIFLTPELFETQWRLYAGEEHPCFHGDSFPASRELIQALQDFMQEYESRMPNSAAVLQYMGTRIAHILIRLVLGMSPVSHRLEHRAAIDRVVLYLHTHYGDKVLVDDLAEVASLSPAYFSRVFKQETGRTPLAYLLDLRLERSRRYLESGEMSVPEIARVCGFQNSSHFSSSFRMKYKTTPAGYRKSS